MKTLSIIIPVYNEEKLIAKTIRRVISADSLGLEKEIIVVDDGSTDGTQNEIKSLLMRHSREGGNLHNKRMDPRVPFRVNKPEDDRTVSIKTIFNKKNQGKGAALKAGFKRATGDILMVQDADEEYSVKDYPTLLSPFLQNGAQIVYGSRNKKREVFHNKYSYFIFYLGGLLLTWMINILYGLKLTDQPTGYKLFSKKVKHLLFKPVENRFSYEVALTATLAKQSIPFVEVPIHYKPRTMAEGKKINWLDFVKSVVVAVKYKLIN